MFSLQPSLFEVSLPGFLRYWSSTTGSVLCTLGEGEEGGMGDRTASLSASHHVTSVTTLWVVKIGGKSWKDVSSPSSPRCEGQQRFPESIKPGHRSDGVMRVPFPETLPLEAL